MPARTGEEYIAGLRELAPEVYIGGERVEDVTTHPALSNGARTMAKLYDMQHDPAIRDEMTYISPTTGDRVGRSFITPRTIQDLEQRRVMMSHWARASCPSGIPMNRTASVAARARSSAAGSARPTSSDAKRTSRRAT